VPAAALRYKPDAAVLAQYAGGAAAPAAIPGKTIWVMNGQTIAPVAVTPGASDGTYTEVSGASVGEGALVVTRAVAASATSSSPSATNNPLLPTRPGGRQGR